jgi:hypothetical protein
MTNQIPNLPKEYNCGKCKLCKCIVQDYTSKPDKFECSNKMNIIDHVIQTSKLMEEEAQEGWASGMQKYDTAYMTSVLLRLKDQYDIMVKIYS